MPKRRRKLSKSYESLITKSLKDIELITAKIHDIDDDDIRLEYAIAFSTVKKLLDQIHIKYKEIGYDTDSDDLFTTYLNSLESFKSEYEI
ncbi:hypothetical protein [Prochlorococcus marinus]|uniref:hypothetical protein n=1 Tax=Prochlorococcus marinus TaxID=1219 RepID=UPI0022B50080|nr:hypothetical protein [Prochlorococcus marinus]